MPVWLEAAFWGLVGGSALIVGACIGYAASLPKRIIAAIMALGAGVLISAVSFELMDEAYETGGFAATAAGFLAGATVYTMVNLYLSRRGAKHRKRSGSETQEKQQSASEGSGIAIAAGALLDGIPESVVIGVSVVAGGGVSLITVAAVFLSNVPEGLASAAGMRAAGRSRAYIFGVWGGIALASGFAALLGAILLADANAQLTAATNAVAAGAILAMLADTMMPEAFDETHEYAGLITVAGFLLAFVLSKLEGG